MYKKPLPHADLLNALLEYQPETGKLYWKTRTSDRFRTLGICDAWNRRHAGREAFTYLDTDGYLQGRIDDIRYRAHRIIIMMVTGEEPDLVDHINRIRTDNRWSNLRQADHRLNSQNRRPAVRGHSSHVGVSWHRASASWRAQIGAHGLKHHLGTFPSLAEAVAARRAAEVCLCRPKINLATA